MLSPNSHAKIHPVDLIKNPELFDREPEIVPETSGKSGKIFAADSMDSEYDGAGELVARERGNAPFRARSVSFSVSQRIRRTSTASFLTNASGGTTSGMNVEILINFLTTNLDQLAASDREYLRRFEELSLEVLCEAHDAELHRIFKAHGWTGSRYRSSEDKPLEAPSLLQALSNLYLKNKMSNYTTHISNLFGIGDEKGADQILSFCPDLLLTCLKTQGPIRPHSTDVRTYTFTGACMLADISGFSKFSGSMCQKGVSGLDDLREATSGFLGHLVKTVYEYHGDGKLS